MNRQFTFTLITALLLSSFLGSAAGARQKSKPWPEINLSTVPSVVGMANSWTFEINRRSPVYLADLDKMYIQFAFGTGKNSNSLERPSYSTAFDRYGYPFYRDINYKNTDFRLDIYSNLGRKTFGSLWVVYGKDRNANNKRAFLESVPSRLNFKTAFAWKLKENITIGVSGSLSNYPLSYIIALQPLSPLLADTQYSVPAGDGENWVSEVDLLYRTKSNIDIVVGGIFHRFYEKFDIPVSPLGPDGQARSTKDTSKTKESIYSGAPRVSVKKTFSSGSYIRGGGAVYFNLVDYQYAGAGKYDTASLSKLLPSYRLQSFETLIPKWKFYAEGTKMLGLNGALYGCIETGRYPNALTRQETDFVPLRLSLANLVDLSSTALTVELTGKLTRILHGMVGFEARYFSNGDDKTLLDDRSMYLKLRAGGSTRIYRSLWWTVRVPDFRLYTSKKLGSAILFENKSYIETDLLLLGL